MTADDIEHLSKSPPKIKPKRKNMKIVNNKAMIQFGSEAFHIQVDDIDAKDAVRLSKYKDMMSPINAEKDEATLVIQVEKDCPSSLLTPKDA